VAAAPAGDAAPAPAGLAAMVGDRLIYTIVVSNGGPADATNVRVDDVLSATTPAVSAVATQGTCALASSTTISCSLGTIAAGANATVTVTARAVASGVATNTATVVADQPAANPGGLQATTTVKVTPAPVYDRSVNLLPISGKVSFRLPNTTSYVPLLTITNVPARTEVNAVAGIAGVVSARTPANTPQTGKFTGGRFVVSYQPPIGPNKNAKNKQRPLVTQLRLSAPLRCPTRISASSSQPQRVRSLWGNGKGNFATSGRYAAATVRGTEWFTKDTCRSTTIRVRRGRVDVYDFLHRKHVTVTTGKSYTDTQR
jgi:uncharacterized repeat protein (TIGR01451 family)